MIIRIDAHSHAPPYEQIRSQLATMCASGLLPIETRLPSIRQLAADLGLASGTVARAYRELEQEDIIETRGRHGTFVTKSSKRSTDSRAIEEAARSFVVQATQLGVDPQRALESVRRAFKTPAITP
jgi:DNA-binding transcriptional regulator YhcF (GntR family)